MRALRFLRTSEDGGYAVLESTDGQERFHLLIDAALRDAVRADLPRLSNPLPTPEASPTLSPREIQVRVRAGEDPQALADEYAMAPERVLRFAEAVLHERTRMAEEARRARAQRTTPDGHSVVFGEAVDERFAAHGIDPGTVRWDSRRREDGQWVIVASWLGGEAQRYAEWAFSTTGRVVAALDDAADALLSDRPIHPIKPVGPPPPTAAPEADEASRSASVVRFPATPDAQTGPLPRREELFDQFAYDAGLGIRAHELDEDPELDLELNLEPFGTAPLPLALPTPDEGRGASAREAGAETAERAQRPRLTNLGITHREQSDEERAERARIPSWDDILLGVRRKGD